MTNERVNSREYLASEGVTPPEADTLPRHP